MTAWLACRARSLTPRGQHTKHHGRERRHRSTEQHTGRELREGLGEVKGHLVSHTRKRGPTGRSTYRASFQSKPSECWREEGLEEAGAETGAGRQPQTSPVLTQCDSREDRPERGTRETPRDGAGEENRVTAGDRGDGVPSPKLGNRDSCSRL